MTDDPAGTTAPQAILVALDFAASSRRALEAAFAWRAMTSEITALHVLDTDLAERIEAAGLGGRGEVMTKLRERAEQEFGWLAKEKGADAFASMIVEGVPFFEIVKIARDLEVDLIAMGTHTRSANLGQLLFGNTAEKVLRTSRCPVLCVP